MNLKDLLTVQINSKKKNTHDKIHWPRSTNVCVFPHIFQTKYTFLHSQFMYPGNQTSLTMKTGSCCKLELVGTKRIFDLSFYWSALFTLRPAVVWAVMCGSSFCHTKYQHSVSSYDERLFSTGKNKLHFTLLIGILILNTLHADIIYKAPFINVEIKFLSLGGLIYIANM